MKVISGWKPNFHILMEIQFTHPRGGNKNEANHVVITLKKKKVIPKNIFFKSTPNKHENTNVIYLLKCK